MKYVGLTILALTVLVWVASVFLDNQKYHLSVHLLQLSFNPIKVIIESIWINFHLKSYSEQLYQMISYIHDLVKLTISLWWIFLNHHGVFNYLSSEMSNPSNSTTVDLVLNIM
ncbi:hypothetical protein BC833DRAFT_576040 [Globomyces pollinis-pini]|nr:hypothetical protein BC833DRAFT_576040 [Globomyces pollinis-pini]